MDARSGQSPGKVLLSLLSGDWCWCWDWSPGTSSLHSTGRGELARILCCNTDLTVHPSGLLPSSSSKSYVEVGCGVNEAAG